MLSHHVLFLVVSYGYSLNLPPCTPGNSLRTELVPVLFIRLCSSGLAHPARLQSWERTSQLSTRNLTSVLHLDLATMYHWSGYDGPSSLKTAFLSLMKCHSATWIPTVLGWLAPGQMPGNILAEIVAADIGSSEPNGEHCSILAELHN